MGVGVTIKCHTSKVYLKEGSNEHIDIKLKGCAMIPVHSKSEEKRVWVSLKFRFLVSSEFRCQRVHDNEETSAASHLDWCIQVMYCMHLDKDILHLDEIRHDQDKLRLVDVS